TGDLAFQVNTAGQPGPEVVETGRLHVERQPAAVGHAQASCAVHMILAQAKVQLQLLYRQPADDGRHQGTGSNISLWRCVANGGRRRFTRQSQGDIRASGKRLLVPSRTVMELQRERTAPNGLCLVDQNPETAVEPEHRGGNDSPGQVTRVEA